MRAGSTTRLTTAHVSDAPLVGLQLVVCCVWATGTWRRSIHGQLCHITQDESGTYLGVAADGQSVLVDSRGVAQSLAIKVSERELGL